MGATLSHIFIDKSYKISLAQNFNVNYDEFLVSYRKKQDICIKINDPISRSFILYPGSTYPGDQPRAEYDLPDFKINHPREKVRFYLVDGCGMWLFVSHHYGFFWLNCCIIGCSISIYGS